MAKYPLRDHQDEPTRKRNTKSNPQIPEHDQSLWAVVNRRELAQRPSLLTRILRELQRLYDQR